MMVVIYLVEVEESVEVMAVVKIHKRLNTIGFKLYSNGGRSCMYHEIKQNV